VALRDEAVAALPWMIATLPLALITSVLNGALEGRSKFIVINGLQVTGTVFFQIVPLLVAYRYSPSLSYVIPAAVLTRAFMNIPVFVACIYCVRLSSFPGISVPAIKSLLAYGGWVAVSGIIGPIVDTVDRLLIGIILGAQAVTYYTVPYQLVTKARVIPGSLSRVLFQRFSADNSTNADKLAFRSLLVLLVVMTPVVVCGILLLKPLMTLWIGKDLAVIMAPLGMIILVGVWFNSLAQIPCFLMMGKGRPDIVSKLHLLEIGPFLLILWFAMKYWGVYGAAWAWTIRALVDNVLLIKISGMAKDCLSIMVSPTIILTGALVVANFVSDESLIWRLGLFFLFMTWIWVWIKRQDDGIISKIVFFRKAASHDSISIN
ncbi:MAG: oligosaccharide flippase family protein, partial [Thiotrichaceae bacterium]|nr:oligosaccharide flippase family protein [Thiotrichaceae bacterium]